MLTSDNYITTTGGISLGISIREPDFYTEAEFRKLSYIIIGSIIDVGRSGRIYNTVELEALDTRKSLQLKGHYDEGFRYILLGRNTVDPGQDTILHNLGSDDLVSFSITYNNKLIIYFTARIMSYTDDDRTSDSIVGSTVKITNCNTTIRTIIV